MNAERGECKHPMNQADAARHVSANATQPVQHAIPNFIMVRQQFWHEFKSSVEDQRICSLVTDITIKEEPIDLEDSKDFKRVPEEAIHEDEHNLSGMQSQCEERKVKMLHTRKRLRCPECSTSFIHGPYAAGLEMLVGHIYRKHTRLRVSCLSATRSRYSAIIRDAVAQGYLPTCSGLVLPSD